MQANFRSPLLAWWKFACISGTQSLDDAYNWIRAGRNRSRATLVIATDTALYARDDPGEATQGAGAVAFLVDEDPGLVELSTEQGYGSADETDFLKPQQQFPSVDGKRSVQVYLARMREIHLHRALAVHARELLLGFQEVRLVGAPVPLLGREFDNVGVFVDE